MLKRELDRMEAELRTKDAIISDNKNITQILQVFHTRSLTTNHIYMLVLQGKLDLLNGKKENEFRGQGDAGPIDGAVERIRC